MNPVWKRELRARWRGRLAFALVFFYVAVLALVFVWQYGANANQSYQQFFDPMRRLSLQGHNLFALLAWLQIAFWMLLAPVLTATSITGEREKGLLESLHLSRLTAREIVIGKLLSALSFVALMIAITLPIVAVCFLMGGVSPGDFLMALALHIATAICCASIGIAVSSWCKTGMVAIVLSIAAIGTWCGLTYVAAIGAFTGFNPSAAPLPWPQSELLELFFKAHPVTAILQVVGILDISKGLPWKTSTAPWKVCLVFLSAFTLFNLWIASKGTRRLLFDGRRFEWQNLRRDLQVPDATNLTARIGSTLTGAAAHDPKSKRFEFGFLARWHFSNPVLGREVRSCFRPRSTSLVMLVIAGALLPVAAVAYAQGFYWALSDEKMRAIIGPSLLVIYLMMAILLCSILGAGGLAREREGATWETLKLSLLLPREILWGKMGTPLLMCAFCGTVFLPILLLCVRAGSTQGKASGISISQLLAAHLIIISAAWFCTLLGLSFSHFSKKPATAICWTLGTLFVTLIALPVFITQTGSYETQRLAGEWLEKWHPVVALMNLFDAGTNAIPGGAQFGSTVNAAWPCALVFFIVGAVLYVFLLCGLSAKRESL